MNTPRFPRLPHPVTRDDSAAFHFILAALVGALVAVEAAVMLGILP